MFALKKLRARSFPGNQAHVTNLKESPALLAADAAEAAARGFAEIETTVGVARYAPLNAISLLVGSQTGPAGRDDAVRGRGAPQPRARDPGPRDLRGDALGLRHRGGLRRRRRHALVEGVPRRRLRVARRQGALHLGHRLRGADGRRRGQVDALPRVALHLGRARGGLAGRAERLDLVRRARALGPGRHAGDPRRERDRRLARPRGRLGQRRDLVALGDPQDRQADGAVPAGHRLRDVRLLGHAAPRQHVRRRQLRRRRPRRVAHDPAGLAGRRRHRAGLRAGPARRAPTRRARGARGLRRARPARDLATPRSRRPRPATTAGDMPDRDRAADVEAADGVLARGVSGLDVAVALDRHGFGDVAARRRRHAAPARLRRLPADLRGDRRRRHGALGRQQPERLPRARAPATASRARAGSCLQALPHRIDPRRLGAPEHDAPPLVEAIGPAAVGHGRARGRDRARARRSPPSCARRSTASTTARCSPRSCDGVREAGGRARLVRIRRIADVAFIAHDGARLAGSRLRARPAVEGHRR